MTIIWSPEQEENLKLWKKIHQSDERARQWENAEDEAHENIQKILLQFNFEQGGNISAEGFDQIFRFMKKFSSNQALQNFLYKNNGLDNFNVRLRDLYFGNDPLPKCVDNFLQMKGIGIQTLSQFLVAFDPSKYAFVSNPTRDMLNLDASQEETARQQALERYKIQNDDEYLDRTIDYLSYTIIFESVKEFTGLPKYNEVNVLIWLGKLGQEDDSDDEFLPFGSISLENDLRDYLATNPSVIEKGLILIQKEYDTKEAGRIDLLCKDKNGNSVVIELKKGKKSDEVVGQILRYIGWVMNNQNAKVRGIIIVNEPDDRLGFAVMPLKNLIEIKYYKVKFEISSEYSAN
jgi:hypothetical protein